MKAMTNNKKVPRDFLVLWKWDEALRLTGEIVTSAVGTHSGSLNSGDRMFVWAVHQEELYLLGAIKVRRSGGNWAEGQSIYGKFQRIPLKGLKWRLRFQQTTAEKLRRDSGIAMQVRARRHPTSQSVLLLEELLNNESTSMAKREKEIADLEGKLRTVTLSKPERSRTLRVNVLAVRGLQCEICEFDFANCYGEFAKNCVEIHHLRPLGSSGPGERTTTVDDLIVVCPNCHRALHQSDDPSNVKAFRRKCNLG
jgi:HNH endonuclease